MLEPFAIMYPAVPYLPIQAPWVAESKPPKVAQLPWQGLATVSASVALADAGPAVPLTSSE